MAETTEQKAERKSAAQEPTDYIVLQALTSDGQPARAGANQSVVWVPITDDNGDEVIYPARKKDEAVKTATLREGGHHEDGIWRAISARAWRGQVEIENRQQMISDIKVTD